MGKTKAGPRNDFKEMFDQKSSDQTLESYSKNILYLRVKSKENEGNKIGSSFEYQIRYSSKEMKNAYTLSLFISIL